MYVRKHGKINTVPESYDVKIVKGLRLLVESLMSRMDGLIYIVTDDLEPIPCL